MLTVEEWARQIFFGGRIEDKLTPIPDVLVFSNDLIAEIPRVPARSSKLLFQDQQLKFPKDQHLKEEQKLSQALHSFANHELLAIEMMACALIYYPANNPDMIKFKKAVAGALKDEQKHLGLYLKRIGDFGHEFGDFPLNDFFWRQMSSLKTPQEYLAAMSLTFESANLDFAYHYWKLFEQLGDLKSANIMKEVLDDEISHVAIGAHFLKNWQTQEKLWDYYIKILPFPLTPARAKGKFFQRDLRFKAALPEDFILGLETYQDEFRVTKRKEWDQK